MKTIDELTPQELANLIYEVLVDMYPEFASKHGRYASRCIAERLVNSEHAEVSA